MKVYSKDELKMNNGYIVTDSGDVVGVNPTVVAMANNLETELQMARYLAKQPEATPRPTLDGFTRKHDNEIELFECETPIADKQAEETMAFLNELDTKTVTDKMNKMLVNYEQLILFVNSDTIVGGDLATAKFDTPTLGNPLTWTSDTIYNAIAELHGCSTEDVETNVEQG